MRRIATAVSGLVGLAVAFIATAPASFAMRVPLPADGDAPSAATRLTHHAGLTAMNIVLIVGACVLVLAAVGVAVVQLRRRPRANPALSH